MPSTSYPVHEPVQELVPFLRSSLENVYVVSHEGGKLFRLKDLTMTEDPELITLLNKMIVDSCTGKTNYDVAWWVGGFNNFMAGFCNRHYNF